MLPAYKVRAAVAGWVHIPKVSNQLQQHRCDAEAEPSLSRYRYGLAGLSGGGAKSNEAEAKVVRFFLTLVAFKKSEQRLPAAARVAAVTVEVHCASLQDGQWIRRRRLTIDPLPQVHGVTGGRLETGLSTIVYRRRTRQTWGAGIERLMVKTVKHGIVHKPRRPECCFTVIREKSCQLIICPHCPDTFGARLPQYETGR